MKKIKTELDVDFIGDQKESLTKMEEKALSQYFQKLKVKNLSKVVVNKKMDLKRKLEKI
jgi:hypothetical protein